MLTPLLPRYLSSLLSIQGHGGNTQHPSRALPPSPEECVPTAAVDRRQFSAQIAAGIGIGGLASVFTTNVAPSSAYASLQKATSNYPPSPPSGTNTAAQRTMNFPRVHPGLTVGNVSTGVLCEIFVDFACPYSRKLVQTVLSDVAPDGSSTYLDKMAFTFHNMIQPWHHQSLWLHESAFAVKILYPDVELAYWKALFEDAPNWYDKEIYGLTRAEFYDKLTAFAAGVVIANSADQTDAVAVKAKLLQYLIPPLQEGGHFPPEARALLGSNPDDDENAVFPLSRQIVKYARKRGVHVTPTVFVNGIEQGQISSGWSKREWTEFLSQALA